MDLNPPLPETKRCKLCDTVKIIDNFQKLPRGNYRGQCKSCCTNRHNITRDAQLVSLIQSAVQLQPTKIEDHTSQYTSLLSTLNNKIEAQESRFNDIMDKMQQREDNYLKVISDLNTKMEYLLKTISEQQLNSSMTSLQLMRTHNEVMSPISNSSGSSSANGSPQLTATTGSKHCRGCNLYVVMEQWSKGKHTCNNCRNVKDNKNNQ